ncbi:MAG TPA: hypothetical protein VHE53_02055 [Patescibacteria group bacterium]|nr:hypothetical protein [Patescibacteria group bacterium]
MPGNKVYKLNQIKDKFLKFWYFGDFGQFDYNLKLADKNLVEAKILFDYKQYLLGYQALLRSDDYYQKVKPALKLAQTHNKDVSDKKTLLSQASQKHVEELMKMKKDVPQDFNWSPEKSPSTNLNLWQAIDNSIKIRKNIYD